MGSTYLIKTEKEEQVIYDFVEMKSGSHPYPFPLGRDLVAGQQGVAVENMNHGDVEETFSFQQKKSETKSVEKWNQDR